MFKEVNQLLEKQSELINNRDKGKFKVKEIVEKYDFNKPEDVSIEVGEYVNEKVEIRWIKDAVGNNQRRGVFTNKKIYKGDTIMVNQAYIMQKDVGSSSLDKMID